MYATKGFGVPAREKRDLIKVHDTQTIHFGYQPLLTCTSMHEGHHSMSVNLPPLVHFCLFCVVFFQALKI